MHKAWRGPGELQGHFRARITPHQGLHLSPLGKKNYSPIEQVGAARKIVIAVGTPPTWRLGDSQLPPPPQTLLSAPRSGRGAWGQVGSWGGGFQNGPPSGGRNACSWSHGPFSHEVGAGGEGGFWPILEESQDFRNTFRVCLWGRSLPERETGMAQSGRENTESSMPLRLVAIFCLSQCAKG